MMRIESVAAQPDRAGRYTVKFEDGTVMRLYRQTVEDFGLYAGKVMADDELSQLHTAAGAPAGLHRRKAANPAADTTPGTQCP